MFAWEAARKGLDVHMLAEPTKLEALKSEFETKKSQFKSEMDKSILEKYGGQEHLEAPPRYVVRVFAKLFRYRTVKQDVTLGHENHPSWIPIVVLF
jgi:pre-mRNA-processing factor SLU7